MSVSNIIGDTSNDNDAKKVRWANIVCNSIYSLNGFNGKDINVENIDAISIDTEDLKATNIIVTNINGKPPASVKNSSSPGSSLVSEPNPSDYEVRRLQSGIGISLVESPGAIEINSSGVTAVNSLGTGETLLNPSGAGPVLGIKSLVAGANVTLTPTGNDITISSAGGGGSANFYFAIGSPPIEDGAFVTDGTLQLSVLAFDDVGGQNNIIRDPISPFGLQVNNKVAIFSFTIQVISVIPTGYPYYPVEFYIRNETSGIYYIAGYTNAVGTIGLTRILPAFPNAKWNLYVRGPAAPSAAEICPISISIWTIT